MDRVFGIGDTVLCTESGVVGEVLNFYTPTSCERQVMVLTGDGRKYHAPISTWVKYDEGSCKNTNDIRKPIRNTEVINIQVDIPKNLIDEIQRVLINHVEFIKRSDR